jgi:hypothetical protein
MTGILRERLQPDDVLVCPLGIGGHADHLIVRQAVEGLDRPLWYYADVPYVLNHPEALAPSTRLMTAERRDVSSGGLAAWVQGIAAYESQISTLFESPLKMKEAMDVYGEKGVVLWRVE